MSDFRQLYCSPKCDYFFKEGDNIICIENAGRSECLTVGKAYKVIKVYEEFGANEVGVIGDGSGHVRAFASRFTTLKIQRKEKLEKINDK